MVENINAKDPKFPTKRRHILRCLNIQAPSPIADAQRKTRNLKTNICSIKR